MNCQSCVVDHSSDTVARCTECNAYYRLIDATINAVDVVGNCYCMYSFIVSQLQTHTAALYLCHS